MEKSAKRSKPVAGLTDGKPIAGLFGDDMSDFSETKLNFTCFNDDLITAVT